MFAVPSRRCKLVANVIDKKAYWYAEKTVRCAAQRATDCAQIYFSVEVLPTLADFTTTIATNHEKLTNLNSLQVPDDVKENHDGNGNGAMAMEEKKKVDSFEEVKIVDDAKASDVTKQQSNVVES